MPRTTYRFRVAPLLINEPPVVAGTNGESGDLTTHNNDPTLVEQGDWSEISNIATKDNQSFEIAANHCAALVTKGSKKWLDFEKAGTMLS